MIVSSLLKDRVEAYKRDHVSDGYTFQLSYGVHQLAGTQLQVGKPMPPALDRKDGAA